jgi:CelD/BcsL family acetyltransferase involved in cellulose biosynthesis
VRLTWLPPGERAAAGHVWQELEPVALPPLAASWRWTETWLEHFGEVVPHRFAVAEESGSPVAIVLVTRGLGRRRARVPIRSLHLGTAGEPSGDSVFVERNGLVAVPEHRTAVAAALLRLLDAERGWDELVLDGFTEEDASALMRVRPFEARLEASRTFDLRAADGDVLGLLSAKTRANFRRSLKRLEVVAAEWAADASQARAFLDELIDLHRQRWESRGQRGVFASPRFTAFHRDLVGRLAATSEVCLFRIRDASTTLSSLYALIDGDRVMTYQHGTPIQAGQRPSPGLVAEVMCMQACHDRGLAVYDHLAGDTEFKRSLSTGADTLVWASGRRGRLRWAAVDSVRAIAGARRRTRSARGTPRGRAPGSAPAPP